METDTPDGKDSQYKNWPQGKDQVHGATSKKNGLRVKIKSRGLFFETSEDLGWYFTDSLLGKRVLRTVRGLPIAQKRETCGCKFNLMKYNLRHVKSTKFLKE